jgi:hypothetical protein
MTVEYQFVVLILERLSDSNLLIPDGIILGGI